MGKWNGTGIPPTRRKLHRMREAKRREAKELARALQEKAEVTDVLISDQEINSMTEGCAWDVEER